MSDIFVSRSGQVNQSGDARALFQKVFTTEVMAAFQTDNPFDSLQRVRSISNAKSAEFPYLGNIGAGYHTPGAELVGGKINHASTIIPVDNLLVSQVAIANIDEAMNYYDVRQPYSTELGEALKAEYASKLCRLMARAARSVGPVSNTRYANRGSSGALTSTTAYGINGSAAGAQLDGGTAKDTTFVLAGGAATAATLFKAIFDGMKTLDNKAVPQSNRFVLLAPAEYWTVVSQGGTLAVASSVMNADVGGSGSLSQGAWPTLAGARIIKTLYMPQLQYSKDANGMPTGTQGSITSDTTGNTGANNYNGDFTTTKALIGQGQGIATVKLLDIATEMEYRVSRQATLMLAKYAMGHGILRPECFIEVATQAISNAANEVPTN